MDGQGPLLVTVRDPKHFAALVQHPRGSLEPLEVDGTDGDKET